MPSCMQRTVISLLLPLNTNLGHIGSTRAAATMQCCVSEARFGKEFCAVRHAHVYNVQRVHTCMCMWYVTEV